MTKVIIKLLNFTQFLCSIFTQFYSIFKKGENCPGILKSFTLFIFFENIKVLSFNFTCIY